MQLIAISVTRMHSSSMLTARPLPYRGVSVRGGGLCPAGLCPGGSLSRGSLCRRSPNFCPGGSLSRRSLSRGSLFRGGGLCPGWGSLSRGFSVWRGLCPGGLPDRDPLGRRPPRQRLRPPVDRQTSFAGGKYVT